MRVRAQGVGLEVCYRQTGAIAPTVFKDIECLSPEMKILLTPITRGHDYKYFIHLSRQLSRGQETTVKLLEDYEQKGSWKAVNQYGYLATHGLEYLEQIITFPDIMRPYYALGKTYIGDFETGQLLESTELKEDDGRVSFIVDKPQLGMNYIIELEYNTQSLKRIEKARAKQKGNTRTVILYAIVLIGAFFEELS